MGVRLGTLEGDHGMLHVGVWAYMPGHPFSQVRS